MIFSSLPTFLFSAHLPVGQVGGKEQEMVAISECSMDVGDATQPLNVGTIEKLGSERDHSLCV